MMHSQDAKIDGQSFELVIRKCKICTASDVYVADIGIAAGRIICIGTGLPAGNIPKMSAFFLSRFSGSGPVDSKAPGRTGSSANPFASLAVLACSSVMTTSFLLACPLRNVSPDHSPQGGRAIRKL